MREKILPRIVGDIHVRHRQALGWSVTGGLRIDSYRAPSARGGRRREANPRQERGRGYAAGRRACATASRRAVCVPNSAAITRVLSLPVSLSDEEIEARIQMESDKYIPSRSTRLPSTSSA
nr:pilus assembly protein PilM [Salinicola acroporae]